MVGGVDERDLHSVALWDLIHLRGNIRLQLQDQRQNVKFPLLATCAKLLISVIYHITILFSEVEYQ